jgi:hypothetical protein
LITAHCFLGQSGNPTKKETLVVLSISTHGWMTVNSPLKLYYAAGGPEINDANMANDQVILLFINATKLILTFSLRPFSQRTKKDKNIQQRGFAGGHPPNY